MAGSLKAEDLIKELFEHTLLDAKQFDQDIVQIVKKHLSDVPIPSKAGGKISTELEQLVKTRVTAKKISEVQKDGTDKS